VDVEYWGLYFYDKSLDKFSMYGAKGFTEKEREEAERTAKHRHPGWVFRNKKMLHIKDTKLDKTGISIDSERDFIVRSRLWLPVMIHGEAIGAFGFASIYPDKFNKEHISTLLFVCNLAGVIFNNIRLLEFEKQQHYKLEQANKYLIRKNEILDNFVYRVSHDLKSPVTSILGMVKLIRLVQKGEEKEVANCLNHIENLSNKFLRTVGDLFELTKIENEFSEEKTESVELHNSVETALADVLDSTKFKKPAMVLDFNGAPNIQGSNAEMLSLFKNLISNSLKYGSQDRADEIAISSYLKDDMIHIDYSDNGIGIDLDKHGAAIFLMFKRFHDHVEGTGLGLYIVKRIVTNGGGAIRVESEVNVGTTFYMSFKKK
jgi:signal transduction histidine kinase